jgi:hypothetical protein
MQRLTLVVAVLVLTALTTAPAAATLNKCAAVKQRCAGKRVVAELKCHERAEKLGLDSTSDPDIQACLQKAQGDFTQCHWGSESKYSGQCLTTNDGAEVHATIYYFMEDVLSDVDPTYPVAVQNACSARKKKCIAKKAAGLLACHTKSTKPPGIDAAKLAACLQKVRDKFDGGATPSRGCFAKLEAKYPGACLTTGDTAALEIKIDDFVQSIVCRLDPGTEPCPDATPTPIPTSACCQVAFGCGNMPPGQPGDCSALGGNIYPGYVCYPLDDPECPIPGACGACGLPPTPTPTPTP